MKVTSLNLAGYKNWNDREANIVSFLNQTQSDIVFLQEVKYDQAYSSHTQSNYINSLLAAPYTYTNSTVSRIFETAGKESREGLAVLSKYPIVDTEVIVLRKRADDKHTRIIQKVVVRIDDQRITFTNVHFSNNDYSDEQLEETLQILKRTNSNSIVLGDFNIFDITTVSDLYTNDYTASAEFAKYISFPSENVTLDYVLMPKSRQFTSFNVGENLSDHNALVFEFEI
jgi:endonuclease/exonuclease/phosphatase family metal-dependent hydrolase